MVTAMPAAFCTLSPPISVFSIKMSCTLEPVTILFTKAEAVAPVVFIEESFIYILLKKVLSDETAIRAALPVPLTDAFIKPILEISA